MKLARLLNTAAIRLALRYALYYVLLTSLGLGALYWSHSKFVDAQIAVGLENELNALKLIDQNQGRERLLQVMKNRSDTGTPNRHYLLLIDESGNKLAGDLHTWPSNLTADDKVRNVWMLNEKGLNQANNRFDYWPMIATRLNDHSQLMVAQGIQQAVALQEFMLTAMVLLLLVIVGMTLMLGWHMGKQMLERVDSISNTAKQILSGDLNSRIKTSQRHDEFDDLATQLNQMLSHLESLIQGMREVTDNIAHDLRHPLTRLRNRMEITLLEARDEQEYRDALTHAIDETKIMIRTFNALLEIAQAETGSYRGEREQINLSLLSQDIGELYQAFAEQKGQRLKIQADADLYVQGNHHLLAQMISNLLENAIKYSGDNSLITIQATRQNAHPTLTISDSGPGIPQHEYQHVLQRYVRLDQNRSTPGSGLGLSLVAATCKLHQAEISLHDNQPGLRIEIIFPEEDQKAPDVR